MKTNHQRGFKEDRDPNVVFNRYTVFGETVTLGLSDRSVSAHVTCGDHTNGKRGIAKDRRGAKKFLNSRSRFHENAALRRIVSEIDIQNVDVEE
jgi:hypothetical protein